MKTFLRLLTFLSPFRWLIALAILLGCITILSNMALLSMAAYLIAAAALSPLLVLLMLPIYIVQFAGVSRAVSRYAERRVAHNATFHLLAQLRTWVYSRLEPLAPAHLFAYRSGDILTRLVSDIEELQNVYLRVISPIVVAIITALVTFGVFSIFGTVLAWVALAFLVATGFGVPLLISVLARNLGKQQLTLRAELNAQIVDGIQGVQDLLAYGHAGTQQQKIVDLDSALSKIQRRMAFISGLQQAMNNLLMNLALWTLLFLAIPLVATKAIDGVYLAFLALLILACFEAVQPLAQAFQFLGHSIAAGERLFKIADTIPQVLDPVAPLPAPDTSPSTGHTVEFKDVHFAYSATANPVLQDISLRLHPGQRIAIVGPSGSGKSTLIRLALRFWDPTRGTIALDGQDIRNYTQEDLRNLISVVSQDTHLFNETVRGNLLLARLDACDSEIEHVLEQAQLMDFVRQLPDGLNTWIGEQGLRLSGGERQRLAIARALLKDAPLLFLDEATANLDPSTEHAVLDTLDRLMQKRTTLIVTHRLVAMERMDEILVLERGQIQERGTHDQLLATHGLYQRLFDMQNDLLTLYEQIY